VRVLLEELVRLFSRAASDSALRALGTYSWRALSADDAPRSQQSESAAIMEVAPQRIEILPNCSLSIRGAVWFFGSICSLSFTIAGLMALLGFWPILPFAGLEMVVLACALRASFKQLRNRETITVSDRDVLVESCKGTECIQVVFPRHWAQVKLRCSASRSYPSRLVIESHGRQCEVGAFLTEEERRGLAQRLGRLIGRINESPTLA
jgi:uncharacterized membrane protein